MYAETFQVGSWLEPQAKWLRWAMQSQKLGDIQYNLQQFWKALESAKKSAKTPLQWAEILTLDGQSQWCLGNLYGSLILEALATQNTTNLVKWAALLPTGILGFAVGTNYQDNAARIQREFTAKKNAAYKLAESLNEKAVKAYEQAKISANQAKNGQVVLPNSTKAQPDFDAWATGQQKNIDQSLNRSAMDTVKEIASMEFLNLPLWVWAAGATALILLLPKPTPTIQLGGARR